MGQALEGRVEARLAAGAHVVGVAARTRLAPRLEEEDAHEDLVLGRVGELVPQRGHVAVGQLGPVAAVDGGEPRRVGYEVRALD